MLRIYRRSLCGLVLAAVLTQTHAEVDAYQTRMLVSVIYIVGCNGEPRHLYFYRYDSRQNLGALNVIGQNQKQMRESIQEFLDPIINSVIMVRLYRPFRFCVI